MRRTQASKLILPRPAYVTQGEASSDATPVELTGESASMKKDKVAQELIDACSDLGWRDRQDGIERLFSCLSWWLDVNGQHTAATTISGVATEFKFNRDSTDVLDHILEQTECISAEELLEQWKNLQTGDDQDED